MTSLRPLVCFLLWSCVSVPVLAQVNDTKLIRISLDSALNYIEHTFDVGVNRSGQWKQDSVTTEFLEAVSPEVALRTLLFGTGLTYQAFYSSPGEKTIFSIRGGKKHTDLQKGHVRNHAEEPIEGVSVGSLLTGAQTQTDAEGYFEIPSLSGDTLTFWYQSYQSTYSVPVVDPKTEIKVRMAATLGSSASIDGLPHLQAQTSTATRAVSLSTQRLTLSVKAGGRNFRIDHIADLPAISALGEEDALRAMESLPGVAMTGESVGNVNIRGGEGDQNLLLYDGIPIYFSQHMFGTVGLFNHKAISQVDAQPGNFSARYGRRVSGVIEAQGRPGDPRESTPGFVYGANLLSMSMGAEVPIKFGKGKRPLALMVALRRSFSDLWYSPTAASVLGNHLSASAVADEQRFLPDTSILQRSIAEPRFFFWDINAKLAWAIAPGQQVSITAFRAVDRLAYRVSRANQGLSDSHLENLQLENQGLSLVWKSRWRVAGLPAAFHPSSQTTLAISRYDNQYTYQLNSPRYQFNYENFNQIQEVVLRHRSTWQIDSTHEVEIGGEWSQLALGQNMRSDRLPSNSQTDDSVRHSIGGLYSHYGQYRWSYPRDLHEDGFWQATLGLRHTYFTSNQRHYWEPRVELARVITPSLKLQATWGRYYQFVRQLRANYNVNVGEDIFALAETSGEASVPVLEATQWSLGGSYGNGRTTETGIWLFSLDGYLKYYQGLAMYSFANEWVLDGSEPELIVPNGGGWVRGLDAMVKYEGNWLEGWVSYSISQAVNQFEQVNGGLPFAARTDQRHQFSVVSKWSILQSRVIFATNWTFASGRPYTPLLGYREDTYLRKLSYAPVNSGRLPDYHRLDLSLHYNHEFKTMPSRAIPPVTGKIGVVFFNVYNRVNLTQRRYRIIPSSQRADDQPAPLVIDQRLLGFSPNIFITLEF